MKRKLISALTLFFVLYTLTLSGQTPTGTLSGEVFDQSGGAVPDATVRITNTATSDTREVKTDAGGRYVQPFLNPGQYRVEVQATGFTPARQDNVLVEVAVIRAVNFNLTVGSISSQVQVEATTPPLDVDSSTVGTVIQSQQIVDLPLNGRNPFSLASLVPGVNNVGNASTPHIGGSRNAVNEETLDGVSNILPENNVGNTTGAYTPIVDSVQEFSVQTNALSAEYGRFGGGVINLVTKSGTNTYHGSGFFFARNGVLDANDFFANRAGQAKPDMHRYQSGGTFGGPVEIPKLYNGKNRTFFFFAFEDTREKDLSAITESVPTLAERSGDFSAAGIATIYDPLTAHQDASGSWVRNAFPGNVISPLRQNPIALAAINFFPLPNTGGPGALTNNYAIAGTSTNNDDHWDTRLDHNFSDKWHSFVRFSHDWNNNTPVQDYGNAATTGWGGPTMGGSWSVSLDHTYTFTPTLIGDFRYGMSRSYASRVPFGNGFDPTSLGLPSSISEVAKGEDLQFPRFDVSSTSGLGANGWVYLVENPFAHDVAANLTKIIGGQTIKFGGEFRKLYINFTQYGQPDGQFSFDNTWTQQFLNSGNGSGNSIASLLLGLPTSGQITHDPTAASSSAYMGYYIQDDWKVTRKLTLNLGFRWDVEIPRTERYNRLSYWDPNLPSPLQGQVAANACLACGHLMGQMVFVNTPGSKYGRSQAPTQWKDFGPRVGFAYNVTDKTVIRSGFGIAYLPSALEAAGTSGAAGTQGFASSTSVNSTLTNYQTINATLNNPFPGGFNLPTGTKLGGSTYLGQAIGDSFFDSYRNPYTMQWNFNIQRVLPGAITVEAGYIGNKSLFLVNGDPGVPYSQVPTSYASLGNQLLQQVSNPFYGVITDPTSPLSAKTVSYNQLLSPFPQYTSVAAFRKPDSASFYNAFTLRVDKKFSNGLTFLLSFTASKLRDNSAAAVTYLGPSSGTYADQYNPGLQWAISPQDVSRTVVGSFLYELPVGKGKTFANNAPRFANLMITGWAVNGILSFSTGTPIIIGGANVNTGLKTVYGEPPDNNGTSAAISNPNIYRWFNTSVFSNPAAFTIGNAGRTLPDVRNPGVTSADLSLFKNNYFGNENRYNVQFRLEAFNALNHPQFAGPDTNINDTTFGVISSTAVSPRQVQLALKFLF